MNIDKLIFPRFKRFKTMNLGLKRLSFLLTFSSAIIALGGLSGFWYLNEIPDKGAFLALGLIVGLYVGFWILLRIIYWIIDGFKPEVKSNSANV